MSGRISTRPGAHAAFVTALLIGLLGLTGLLAYQAAASARSHRRVAEKSVSEFTRVATWEFTAAARREIASAVTVPGLDIAAERGAKKPEEAFQGWDALAAGGVAYGWVVRGAAVAFFSYELVGDTLAWRFRPTLDAAHRDGIRRWARPSILAAPAAPFDPRWNQAVTVSDDPPHRHVLAYRLYPVVDPVSVYGVVLEEEGLVAPLKKILGVTPVLPPALLDLDAQRRHLAVRVDLPGGGLLATAGREPAEGHRYAASDTMGVAFAGLDVTLGVDEAVADRLVIGGLPGSRMVGIVALLLLTMGTIGAAITLLRREAELSALRADFVSSVSHELRTPIAQIRMFAETLRLGRVRSDEERDRSLDILVKESTRLAHQVDNVLLFSRAERETLDVSPASTPLRPLLGELVDGFAPLAATRNMTVEVRGDDVRAPVDRLALEQAVLNLLDNAVKYGPEGQTVVVGLHRTDPGRVRVTVDDEGPGIPSGQRDRVWEPYTRLERDRQSAVAGTGVGLAVVRAVARRHGGRAWVDQAPGGGARIVLDLPAPDDAP